MARWKTTSTQFSFVGRWNTPSGTCTRPSVVPEQPSSTSTLS
jgi:hypothetical protein